MTVRTAAAAAAISMLAVAAPILPLGAEAVGAAEESHLRFFQSNRDWLLRAFESLPRRPAAPGAGARAWSFDPFTSTRAQDAARAAFDSAATLDELGAFRDALDSLIAAADSSAARLDDLDRRFAAHLRTAIEVTLAAPQRIDVRRVESLLDGVPAQAHELDEVERAALVAGGVLEVLRRVVEPRVQVVEVRVWTAGAAAPSCTRFAIDPVPDALSICHLDLQSAAEPARLVRTTLGSRE